jgi:hypothetical protein
MDAKLGQGVFDYGILYFVPIAAIAQSYRLDTIFISNQRRGVGSELSRATFCSKARPFLPSASREVKLFLFQKLR